MVHDDPVVEVVQGEAQREDDDWQFVQSSGRVENHADLVSQIGPLVVDVVINLVKLQSDDGEDDGVLQDGAEDHEDAGHQVGVDSIQFGQTRGRSIGPNRVKDIDEDQEEDDEERHPPGDDLGVDDEADPWDENEEAAGNVDLKRTLWYSFWSDSISRDNK